MPNETCILTTKDFTILEVMRDRCLGQEGSLAPILKRKIESAVVMFRDDVPENVATLSGRVTFSVNGRDPDLPRPRLRGRAPGGGKRDQLGRRLPRLCRRRNRVSTRDCRLRPHSAFEDRRGYGDGSFFSCRSAPACARNTRIRLGARLQEWARQHSLGKREGPFGTLLVSIYGGYFNGGLGIVLLALFSLWGMRDFNLMNGLKTGLSFVLSAISVVSFAAAGLVAWPQAALMWQRPPSEDTSEPRWHAHFRQRSSGLSS